MSPLAWPKRKVCDTVGWLDMVLFFGEMSFRVIFGRIGLPILIIPYYFARLGSLKQLSNKESILKTSWEPTNNTKILERSQSRGYILIDTIWSITHMTAQAHKMESRTTQLQFNCHKSQRLLLPHVYPWHTCANWCNAKRIRRVRSDYAWWIIKTMVTKKGCPSKGANKNQVQTRYMEQMFIYSNLIKHHNNFSWWV